MRTQFLLLLAGWPALVAAQALSDDSITIALGVTAFVSLLFGALLTLAVDKAMAKYWPPPAAPRAPTPALRPPLPKPVMHDAASETDTILVVLLPQGPERALDRAALASRIADAVAGRQPAFRSPIAAADGFGAFAPPPTAGEEEGSVSTPVNRSIASPSAALPVSPAFEQAWVSRGIASGEGLRLPSPPVHLVSPLFPPSPATPHSPMRFGRWDSSASNVAASQALVGGLSQWSVQQHASVELEAPREEPEAEEPEAEEPEAEEPEAEEPAAEEPATVPVEPTAAVEDELALSVGEEEEGRGDITIDVLSPVAEEEVEAPVTAISPNSLPSSPRLGSSSSTAADAAFASAASASSQPLASSYETFVMVQADVEEFKGKDSVPWIETVTLPGAASSPPPPPASPPPRALRAAPVVGEEEDRGAFVIDGQHFSASTEEEGEEGGFALTPPLAPSPDRSHYVGRRTSGGSPSRNPPSALFATLSPLGAARGTSPHGSTRRPAVAAPDLSTRIAAHLSALTLVRPGAHPPAEIMISPLANSPYLQHVQPAKRRPGSSARPRSRG